MLKMRDLLQEGRNLQEKFKKNVLIEATTIKSKINPALSIKVGDDSITLVTPYGSITFEVAGQYDDFSTDGGVAMDYTKAKGGITQSEWETAADAIFDFVSNEPDYLKATEKLINTKLINKYIPKLVGKPMSSGEKPSSTTQKKSAVAPMESDSLFNKYDGHKILLKRIPSRYRDRKYRYVGSILDKSATKYGVGDRGILYPFNDIVGYIYSRFNEDDIKATKYAKSLYMKNNDYRKIYTDFRGKEELELVYM